MELKENDCIILKNGHFAAITYICEPGKVYMIDEIVDETHPDKTESNTIFIDEIQKKL